MAKQQNPAGATDALTAAAQTIGSTLGKLAVKTGIAKVPAAKKPAKKAAVKQTAVKKTKAASKKTAKKPARGR